MEGLLAGLAQKTGSIVVDHGLLRGWLVRVAQRITCADVVLIERLEFHLGALLGKPVGRWAGGSLFGTEIFAGAPESFSPMCSEMG